MSKMALLEQRIKQKIRQAYKVESTFNIRFTNPQIIYLTILSQIF